MGWSIGFDSKWKRDVGYGVPALLDALESAVAQYAGYPPEVLAEISPEWLDMARKAIERARGE